MYKKDLSRKSEGVESAPSENPSGHDYSKRYRSSEGYAVCSDCGARENTDKAARKCARLVFPMIENWEIARRMVEDRARAELRQELDAARPSICVCGHAFAEHHKSDIDGLTGCLRITDDDITDDYEFCSCLDFERN